MHIRTTAPVPRYLLSAFAVVVLGVAGLTACAREAEQTPSSAAPSTSSEATPEPTKERSPEPTEGSSTGPTGEAEEPTPIILSAAGIGDVAMGTTDPIPALVALLGPPDGTGIPETDQCGPGNTAALTWPDLTVRFDTSAGLTLWGWELRGPDAPPGVTPQSGVLPGAPLADAMALPGATTPEYWESMDELIVGADDVWYSGAGSDPATATVFRVAVNSISCD